MAKLQQRTWSNSLRGRPHVGRGSIGRISEQPFNAKERVPAPAKSGSPYALAKETGCPEGITARRTDAPLA